MKRCTKCNQEYDDSKVFCAKCGSQLASITPTGQSTAKSNTGTMQGLDWIAIIAAVIGLIVEWNTSALFGMAAVAGGFVAGNQSSNSGIKTIVRILFVIGLIMFAVALFA